MKTLLLLLLSFAFVVQLSNAQSKRTKFSNKFDDAFAEEELQSLTLRFFNALDGEPVQGAVVNINQEESYTTDAEGKIRFPIPEEDGYVSARFECPKYITSDFEVEVLAGTLFQNRISVSPMLDIKDLRVVLDWNKAPMDLDSHFYKKNGYHISYRHTRVLSDGTGQLDRDDRDGYGPETITIHDIDDLGQYEFLVHDYSNRNSNKSLALSKSHASVKVYGMGKLLYVFNVPPGIRGNKWSVFKLIDGQFVETNYIN